MDAILTLMTERYFEETTPLIPDEHGDYTRPVSFQKRYYRILTAVGLEQQGLHAFLHTFATNLVNGVKPPDGTIRSLTPRQVADLLPPDGNHGRIRSLRHVKRPPNVVLFSCIRGLLSVVRFYWSCSAGGLFLH